MRLLTDHARRVVKLTVFAWAFAQMASAATTYYVTTNGTGQGTSWADATNSIQGAIDAIEAGAANTVWVSNGVYEVGGVSNWPPGTILTNRVVIWKAITVRSANNDPQNTIIKGRFDTGEPGGAGTVTNGPASVRCVYMTNGTTLIGFMLTNGATLPSTAVANDQYGGGILCQSAVVVSNCIMAGNAAIRGGGAYQGSLYNCELTGNNTSGGYGAGAYSGTLSNCTLIGNRSFHGGGAYACTLYNCLLKGNYASYSSGGGGARDCNMYNCTVVSNSASSSGGGVRTYAAVTLYNCIIYYNSPNNYSDGAAQKFTNCCTTPAVDGWADGNITNAPMFVDTNTANYRLSNNSPCINAGINQDWMINAKDLDGHSRIDRLSGRVDMGAYERLRKGTICGVH